MANNCCCTSIYNAGCIGHCDGLTVSGLTGETVTVLIESGSRQWTQTLAILDGAATVTAFNEEAIHIVKFPEAIEINGETYDCIKVKTEITTNSTGGGSGGGGNLSTFCQDVQACMAGFTPEQPAIQPPATVLIQNTTYNLQGFDLQFTGNQVDGDQLVRNFDPNGNDIGGIEGTNTVGADCLFNSILGIGNTIGDSNEFNSVLGVNNTLGNGNILNSVTGDGNTLGNNNSGIYAASSNVTIGDNNAFLFSYGVAHFFGSSLNYCSAFGVGHNVTHEQSYYFGRYSSPLDTAAEGGLVIGNGTSNIARSNAFEALLNGRLVHSGAYANKPTRYTGGGSHTIPDNVSIYIYDPASVQAGATITLPANPLDGQTLYIFGGGTVTSGNVITSFTLDGNGRTVIGDGAAQLKVGKAIELHYVAANNIWYAISN
jgi:hypothetical protein